MASGAHDLDAHLQLRTDEHALTGALRVGPKVPCEHIDEAVFALFLESRGVSPRKIDRDALRTLIEAVKTNPGAEHASTVVRGSPPRDGARRVLEWAGPIAAAIERINARREALVEESKPGSKPAPAAGDDEPINFYEQSAFIIVQAGDLLGTVSPPDEGEDGEDIFGNSIPAKKSPAPSDIDPETIELTRDHKLIALTRGRLVYSGVQRCIERTLRVVGDVGFETGNIDFPGPVEIAGGVRDKFVVRSAGTVTVRKLVEASTIQSSREIVLERGAAGRETGRLISGHALRAGYLEAVTAEVGQDCIVRHEITNCHVDCRGAVKIPTGAIRGGAITASRGIETSVAGSVQETRTELIVGALAELEDLLRQAKDRISETRALLDPVLDRQAMLRSVNAGKLTPEQIESQMGMEFEIAEHRRRIGELEEACQRLEQNLRDATKPVLHAGQCIHAGVVLWLPGHRAVFRNELKGESLVRIGPGNRPVVDYRGETQPLSKFAVVEPDPRVVLISRPVQDEAAEAA